MGKLGRNVVLGCGHDEALATLHRPALEDRDKRAWCPVCESDVAVALLSEVELAALADPVVMAAVDAAKTGDRSQLVRRPRR